ncbi:glutaredoxin [Lacrimispora saccharolytica]|uniref:Glutaredoxin n=1 Tax=Lacrimispora saccharolytica (strain ATCC 35040 / DSM 2544 / NRCC 2533 / WM1) TaxID=610130 RepID=D9QZD3_LACSW|nr:glutaredoxin [Lacrimispora saccharolytica]ADL04384.1 conserved hypothetical protein [[Clostridium] saccharolyticum WM1]QRV21349.1 glutaredoxin [Lacrimispora saccharolytica]
MKITIIGSHLCPDTLYALNKLIAMKASVDFKNLSADLKDLKAYLAVRETEPAFEAVKSNGGIGIPFFILEDGTKTLNLNEVLERLS